MPLGPWVSLSLANPIAFLAASVASYLGHALLTFREETGGRQFARRWLLLQVVVNLSVCALLPLFKASTLVLVFTLHAAECRDLEPSGPVQCQGPPEGMDISATALSPDARLGRNRAAPV